ncbi:hypothetical protein T190607A01A_40319 [Tenacibaculum sp. 190524A05c]|uniref:HTH luxR-type domain-containing protein n=3 Tax=Tenacibaculum platacis TaxID=3137852 RepID=A0ABM9P4U0_9FLAO
MVFMVYDQPNFVIEGNKILQIMESVLLTSEIKRNSFLFNQDVFSKLIEQIMTSTFTEKQFLVLSNALKIKVHGDLYAYRKRLESLTSKEQEVFDCICTGLVPKEIAVKLYIEVSTAKTHRRNIIKKLSIKSFKDWCLYSSIHDLKKLTD